MPAILRFNPPPIHRRLKNQHADGATKKALPTNLSGNPRPVAVDASHPGADGSIREFHSNAHYRISGPEIKPVRPTCCGMPTLLKPLEGIDRIFLSKDPKWRRIGVGWQPGRDIYNINYSRLDSMVPIRPNHSGRRSPTGILAVHKL